MRLRTGQQKQDGSQVCHGTVQSVVAFLQGKWLSVAPEEAVILHLVIAAAASQHVAGFKSKASVFALIEAPYGNKGCL